MTQHIDYSRLPEHMRDGMRLYIENGIPPGSFLMAVLVNDFMEACKRSDDVNAAAMQQYARFLYNEAPGGCYGSPRLVDEWIAQGGLRGLAA